MPSYQQIINSVSCYKGYCLLFLLLVRTTFNGWFTPLLCFRSGFRNHKKEIIRRENEKRKKFPQGRSTPNWQALPSPKTKY